MKIRMAYLMQAVFALSVAGALSFGATLAFASESAPPVYCTALGYDYYTPECGDRCPGNVGYCSEGGFCRCGYIP